jgi:ribosomal protein S18 acetylase RimI-like enzyme
VTTERASPAFSLPAALLAKGFDLRPETDADIAFLMRLFASTREHELAPLPWTAEQKAAFLAQQFQAQRRHYRTQLDNCAFDVIQHQGVPAGRIYVQTDPTHLHLVDISLLPDWRGQGVGAAILEALQAAAAARDKGLSAFVEQSNPARRLYQRLGFTEVADHGVYLEIVWTEPPPPSVAGASPAVERSPGN